MRTEKQITKEIAEIRAAYQEAAATRPAAEARAILEPLKGLQQELSDLLSAGAKPCPMCGAAAMGMTREAKPHLGRFEVGCPACPIRARAHSVAEAVADWNAGEYTE